HCLLCRRDARPPPPTLFPYTTLFRSYSGKTHTRARAPHGSATFVSELEESSGWYDFRVTVESDASFERQSAGHVETGKPGVTDPAIAGGVPEAARVA